MQVLFAGVGVDPRRIDLLTCSSLPVCSITASLPTHFAADEPGTTLRLVQAVESLLGSSLNLFGLKLGFGVVDMHQTYFWICALTDDQRRDVALLFELFELVSSGRLLMPLV